MYTNVNWHLFQDSFRNYGREKQFSYDALRALFEYIEEWEEASGVKYELDVIGLCCEYAEVDADEFESNYNGDEDLIIKRLSNSNLLIRAY